MQPLVRFLIGGAVVSVFALAGDLLRPKSFAGLFAAAPSVALATLALTAWQDGATVAATEARSMAAAALGFIVYACLTRRLMSSGRWAAAPVAVAALAVWALIAAMAGVALARWLS